MLAQALASWSGVMRRVSHPFEFRGVRPTSTVTRKHVPLIWENMLGTVNAKDPRTGEERYFGYDWDAAQRFARLNECTDLRTCRVGTGRYSISPGGHTLQSKGPLKLYGIPPNTNSTEKQS